MSNLKMARPNNAIDEIALSFLFKKPFSGESFAKALISVHNAVSNELPESQFTNNVDINFRTDTEQVSQEKTPGIVCYKASKNLKNRHEWALHIESNRIIIACSDYPGWDIFSEKAKDFLIKALESINLKENPIIEITSQCTNKFYDNSDEGIVFDELFNHQSSMLTGFIATKKPTAWHLHQGWFELMQEEECTSLHNLNMGVQVINNSSIDDENTIISIHEARS